MTYQTDRSLTLRFFFAPPTGAYQSGTYMRTFRAASLPVPGAVLISVLLLFWSTGCRKSATETSDDSSSFLFINASLHWPEVNIYANGSLLYPNLGFPDSTGYLSPAFPLNSLSLVSPGDSDTLVNLQEVVEPRKTYSVFVIDTGATGNAQATVIPDSFPPVPSGYVLIRFLNFSYSEPNLDLYSVSNSQYLFTDRYFNESDPFATTFTPVPAGTYTLELRATGAIIALAKINGIALQEGKMYTFFSEGILGGPGNSVFKLAWLQDN